ncbi:MAG: hypothetical protein D6780_08675 [Candidatus Dadabacteria bacterium]|nr:MAG: hypothetical protein D6780_08675 [Candidatus Dadabacteria bacterium]
MLNPYRDPYGAGWQTIQSIVTLGSGGLTGKGLFKGSQTQLEFLPERSTDFIFSVIGEELGFLGSSALLLLYFLLLWRILALIRLSNSSFLIILKIGVFIHFLTHIVVNIGMIVGLLPTVGLPLPFVSYGGSALITNFVLLSLAAKK